MQAWDQVIVTTGEYAEKAGVVVRVNTDKEIATVKLDGEAEPVEFAFSELKYLGR